VPAAHSLVPISNTFLTGHLPCVVQEDYGDGDGASSPAGIPPEEADWWGDAGSGDDFADGDSHQEDGDAGQGETRGGRRASARMLATAKVARSGRLPCLASSCSQLLYFPSMVMLREDDCVFDLCVHSLCLC